MAGDRPDPGPLVDFPPDEQTRRALAKVDPARVEADLLWLDQPDRHLIAIDDPRYPALLREIADPPIALFLIGDPETLALPQLGVVGSRNPSRGGEQRARDFSDHLAAGGLAITSGLALGVDAAAHRGALAAGGWTLAVTGTGLDRVYPAVHRELAHEIAAHGALVSEFPPGTEARPGNFPRRNRIISGLSVGVLVVEATLQSGSLITARLAMEQGREVFAIPGSLDNPLARGCHRLIREGAKLVETGQDIIEELGALLGALSSLPATTGTGDEARSDLDSSYDQLLQIMGFDPISADQLVDLSGLGAREVSSMLLLLELEGRVSSAPGGRFVRVG